MASVELDAAMHRQLGELTASMHGLQESMRRVEEQSRRSEDKSDQSRAVVHKRMDEMVNRVHSVEKTMAVVQEDVAEMKPVTDDIKRWKLMGVGGMTVIGFGAMALGVSFADALKRIAGVIIGR